MRKALILPAALGLTLAGCKMMEPKPDSTQPGTTVPASTEMPAAPWLLSIPDTGTVPELGRVSHITLMLCTRTGGYVATGVDLQAQRFSFMFQGSRATQAMAFNRFYAAGVPVTVYTSRMQLLGSTQSPAPAQQPPPPPPPPSPAIAPQPSSGGSNADGSGDGTIDPCNVQISDDPSTKKPGGDDWVILKLSWNTATVLQTVAKPIQGATIP
jgi:hypothetical protein